MRRFVLISDSHGKAADLRSICALHPEAERFVFLGDGAAELERLRFEHPEWVFTAVRGNNDFGSVYPEQAEIVVGSLRILCSHGHRFGVRYGPEALIDEARARGCGAVFYGHTHRQLASCIDGVWAVNPGAVWSYPNPCYAIVDIADNGTLIPNLCEL